MLSSKALWPLLFSLAAGNVVVDLSQDFETTSLDSPGAAAVQATGQAFPKIRTHLVLEQGKIVAEYLRDDVEQDSLYQAWSVTKSWISFLFGFMVQDGLIDLQDTLGDIFTEEADWAQVNATELEFKQNVTIYEMLTMTSGLVTPLPAADGSDLDFSVFIDGGTAGGGTLADSLAFPEIGEKGTFSYLGVSTIMSYVIQVRTGMSPREYAAEKAFPSLGMQDSDIGWWQNADGIEYAYHGIELNSKQMAKLGQLYLQGGLSAPDMQLISQEWAVNSTSVQVDLAQVVSPGDPSVSFTAKYGYLFWLFDGADFGFPDGGEFYCAIGLGGQDICVHPELERVSVQQRDFEDSQQNFFTHAVAFNSSISFEDLDNGVDGGNMTTMTSGSSIRFISAFIVGLSVALFAVIS